MKELIFILFGLHILSGCATHAQKESNRISAQLVVAGKAADTCMKSFLNSPLGQEQQKLFIFDKNEPERIAKLTMNRYLTKQEAMDGIAYSVAINPCRKKVIEEYRKAHQDFALLFATVFAKADADLVNLLNKKLTVGEQNQRIIDRINRAEQEFSKIIQRISSNLEYSHNQQVAQRQRAAEIYHRWANNQALINSINRSRTTNCSTLSSTISCTTY